MCPIDFAGLNQGFWLGTMRAGLGYKVDIANDEIHLGSPETM
jgi:hypothetical protein